MEHEVVIGAFGTIVIVNKKENLPISELCRPGRPQSKIKRKQKKVMNI